MNDSRNVIFHKAENTIRRLKLSCRITEVAPGWSRGLFEIHGNGSVPGIKSLAEEMQADILTPLPEEGTLAPEEWVAFKLLVTSDDTL